MTSNVRLGILQRIGQRVRRLRLRLLLLRELVPAGRAAPASHERRRPARTACPGSARRRRPPAPAGPAGHGRDSLPPGRPDIDHGTGSASCLRPALARAVERRRNGVAVPIAPGSPRSLPIVFGDRVPSSGQLQASVSPKVRRGRSSAAEAEASQHVERRLDQHAPASPVRLRPCGCSARLWSPHANPRLPLRHEPVDAILRHLGLPTTAPPLRLALRSAIPTWRLPG